MPQNTHAPERTETSAEHTKLVASVYEGMSVLVSALCIVMFSFTFLFRLVGVMQTSMEPTLHEGQSLIVGAFAGKVRYQDIVIITDPHYPNPLVKRVIATGGQKVDIDFELGEVYVDGLKLEEPYIAEPTYRRHDVEFPLTVPEGHVFVLGDNRNGSKDSRDSSIGCIPEKYLLGKVFFRAAPISKWKVE